MLSRVCTISTCHLLGLLQTHELPYLFLSRSAFSLPFDSSPTSFLSVLLYSCDTDMCHVSLYAHRWILHGYLETGTVQSLESSMTNKHTIARWDPGAQLVGSANAMLEEFNYPLPCLWPLNGDAVGVLQRGKK